MVTNGLSEASHASAAVDAAGDAEACRCLRAERDDTYRSVSSGRDPGRERGLWVSVG